MRPDVVSAPSFFADVVRYVTSSEQTELLRLDPRPVRPDVKKVTLYDDDFADVEEDVLRRRRDVLRRFGVPERSASRFYDECVFVCDPGLIKRDEADRVTCPPEGCNRIVVALSVPRRPQTQTHQRSDSFLRLQEEAVVRMFRLSPLQFYVYELRFARTLLGWEMVEEKRIAGGAI